MSNKTLTKVKPQAAPKEVAKTSRKGKRVTFMGGLFNDALRRVGSYFSSIDEADSLAPESGSANAHAHATARTQLKNRSRHETANNSWLKGITRTTKNDLVGRGPRIQITDERFTLEQRLEIAKQYNQWLKDIRYAAKLRTQVGAKRDDGEGFAIAFDIPEATFRQYRWLYRNPLPFTYRVLDSDRFTDPTAEFFDKEANNNDGIRFNQFGDPVMYQVLKQHPGDEINFLPAEEGSATSVSGEYVFHLYEVQRPEQNRGIPENQPGLSLASSIRQYTFAIVRTMCNAASIGGYLKTDLDPIVDIVLDEDGEPEIDPITGEVVTEEDCPDAGDSFDVDPDKLQCLPRGYDYAQHDTPDVVDNHGAFLDKTVTQLGRDACMPRHKATGDSSNYNYASVRSDSQDWNKCIEVDRDDLDWNGTRLFSLWWQRARNSDAVLSREIRARIPSTQSKLKPGQKLYPEHKFHWDGFPHVDPNKEALATTERLRQGQDSLYDVHAAKGQNWDEVKMCHAQALGMEVGEYELAVQSYLFPNYFNAKHNSNNTPMSGAGDNAELRNRLMLLESSLNEVIDERRA